MKNNITIGMDLGNKKHEICVLDAEGNPLWNGQLPNQRARIKKFFSQYPAALVVMEVGSASPWLSRLAQESGLEVAVANPRKVRSIWQTQNKNDMRDAQMLARIGRFDRSLLSEITHRGEQAHRDFELIKARELLVKMRTKIINHIRGVTKSFGEPLPPVSSESFHRHEKISSQLPVQILEIIKPLMDTLERLTEQIKGYETAIENLSQSTCYPDVCRLKQVDGVGTLTAMSFVLSLEDPKRFKKSRDLGAYLGLVPKRDQSGGSDRQLGITKTGNPLVRKLLVHSAHYILGSFGPESDLRRYGMRIAERGGKNAKKRAVVAVARKLAVLLHALWKKPQPYQRFYQPQQHLQAA